MAKREKKDIKLVAIDLDGTLLNSDRQFSRKTHEVISKARAQGIEIVIATARPPRSTRAIYEHLGMDGVSIHYNGALIYDFQQNTTLKHAAIPMPIVHQVVKAARHWNPEVIVSVEIMDRWYTDRSDMRIGTATSKKFKPDYIGNLFGEIRQSATNLMLLTPPEGIKTLSRKIHKQFGHMLSVIVSDEDLIQCLRPGIHKGSALRWVCQRLNIQRENVMAIGDAPNDIGMIRWAGLGVAVANAWDEVRSEADRMVPSNDSDGVAQAIEKFVLK